MEQLVLEVQERPIVGRNASRALRSQGRIPVNLYGPSGNRNLSVAEKDFRLFWNKVKDQTTLFEIKDEKGQATRSLVQEVQTDAISRKVVHVDIREIAKGVEINASVVVHLKGECYGVKNQGGVLELAAHELEVHCLPRHLPHEILVDVTALKLNESIHVRDLETPEGVTFVNDGDEVVVSCGRASKVEEDAATEEDDD